MNAIKKVSQNIFKQIRIRKSLTKRNYLCKSSNCSYFYITTKLTSFCIFSNAVTTFYHIDNFEDDLQKVATEGEPYGILEVMDELEELIITTSQEYRQCLEKQIELIKHITTVASSEMWDELVKFRALTNDFKNELNEYIILLRTIGDIVSVDQNLVRFFGEQKNIEEILKKYQEVEELLSREFEENKKMESELLKINIVNIVVSSSSSD